MNTQELQLAPKPGPIELAQPSVGSMLQAVIDKGVTTENVAAIEKLVGLYERMQEKDAEKQFAAAFVQLQAEMKSVKAVRPVPNRDGTLRYKFAPYEEIMAEVAPRLKAHGFTVTFSTDYKDSRLVKTCILQHVGGHKSSNSFAVRIGGGPPGATETQADGAAATYAKRGALCDALNIIIDHDDDARAEGGSVTLEQAQELKRRVTETEGDEVKFLKLAGVAVVGAVTFEHYKSIPAAKYDLLDGQLARKEARGR